MSTHHILRGLAVTAAFASLAAPATAAPGTPYDLNRDGNQDLVLGLPWAAAGENTAAGAVAVIDGSSGKGLGPARLLSRADLGLTDPAGPYDGTGSGVAGGDFDGDGTADLAVGSPGKGVVSVVYGASAGKAARTQVVAAPAGSDGVSFGSAVTAGDLDQDGFDDLVVAAPGAEPRPDADYGSGLVHVLRGGASGIVTDGATTIHRPDAAWSGFGLTLALGAREGSAPALFEAAAGAPEWSDDPPTPGHLSTIRGDAVTAVQDDMNGGPTSLATGDVNGDGNLDLVAGIPINRYVGEDERRPGGALALHLGQDDGTLGEPIVVTQRTRGVPGTDEGGDRFGAAVAVARIDRDRYADIVVGAPGEDVRRGRVTVLRGSAKGIARRGAVTLDEATRGIPGKRGRDHYFGETLSLLDLTGDGRSDLVAGVPGARGVTGAVVALRATRRGFSTKRVARVAIRSLGVTSKEEYVFPRTRLGRVGSTS